MTIKPQTIITVCRREHGKEHAWGALSITEKRNVEHATNSTCICEITLITSARLILQTQWDGVSINPPRWHTSFWNRPLLGAGAAHAT